MEYNHIKSPIALPTTIHTNGKTITNRNNTNKNTYVL